MKKKWLPLFFALALAFMLLPAFGVTAHAYENYSYSLRVLNKAYDVTDGVITDNTADGRPVVSAMDLPAGITVDVPTCTITLNNYTGTMSYGDSLYGSFIYVSGSGSVTPTIKLIGTNTLTVKDAGWDAACISGGQDSELVICGNGTLNLNLSENLTAFGISGATVTKIQDCTINITSTNPKGYVYGYSAIANRNYQEGADYAALEISNATINIKSTMSKSEDFERTANAGIDVQDSDLVVKNSKITMDLSGGNVFGLCGGLNGAGGKFTIDTSSEITVKGDSAYYSPNTMYFWKGDLSSNNIYAGDSFETSLKVKTADFYNNGYVGRYSCTDKYLEISPHTWTNTITKATTSAPGSIKKICGHCSKTASATIAKIASIEADGSLTKPPITEEDSYYTPSVTVKDADGKELKEGTDYEIKHVSGDFKSEGKHVFTAYSTSAFYDFSKTFTLTISEASKSSSSTTTDEASKSSSSTTTDEASKSSSSTTTYEEEYFYVGKHLYGVTGKGTVSFLLTDQKKGTLTIPATVKNGSRTYKVTSVSKYAYEIGITKVVIGNNVTSIASNAFAGCTTLKTVTLGKNVKTVGASAFYGCTKLTKFTAGAALTTIKAKAFSGCKVLKTVTLTKATGLKTIGASAFSGCKKLNTLTINSTKLTKKTVKSSLKGSSVKTIKVPAQNVSTNKKYFAKSNSGKKVTVKKK